MLSPHPANSVSTCLRPFLSLLYTRLLVWLIEKRATYARTSGWSDPETDGINAYAYYFKAGLPVPSPISPIRATPDRTTDRVPSHAGEGTGGGGMEKLSGSVAHLNSKIEGDLPGSNLSSNLSPLAEAFQRIETK